MAPDHRQDQLDEAFDRIEGTILPSLAGMLETLLEVAEAGAGGGTPDTRAAELRALGAELEALTLGLERTAPSRADAEEERRIAAA